MKFRGKWDALTQLTFAENLSKEYKREFEMQKHRNIMVPDDELHFVLLQFNAEKLKKTLS